MILAGLMAAGAGALLAALTLDLIAPGIAQGEFTALFAGTAVGGLLFAFLNSEINSRGGFLRKVSTSIRYLRRVELNRRKHLIAGLERSSLFSGLPDEELETIATLFTEVEHDGGDRIFRSGDPSNHLRVVLEGQVELVDPETGEVDHAGPRAMFGHQSFVGRTDHHKTAVAAGSVRVLRLDRDDLNEELEWLPVLASRLESEETGDTAPGPPLPDDDFDHCGPFAGLDPDDRDALRQVVFWKEHGPGHVFFHRHQAADRFYFMGKGHVRIVTGSPQGRGQVRSVGDAFGGMAFVVGGRHTTTAICEDDVGVWVLRRADFLRLVAKRPGLAGRVDRLFESGEARQYLTERQAVDPDLAREWEKRARKVLRRGSFDLSVSDVVKGSSHGAPLAIWLGILLDGIPESFVLGRGVAAGAVSLALISGVFFSNFPEALSSSVGMAKQGVGQRTILLLWSAVALVTAIGSGLGTFLLADAEGALVVGIEGLAAGAMLTMIAETMLPEAVSSGGRLTGLWTVGGFLAATALGQLPL